MKMKLAIAHRPRRLRDMIGQDHIVTVLKGFLTQKHIGAQVLMFDGPSGCGKTTLAQLTARYINCENRKGWKPCRKCRGCKLGDSNHDIHVLDATDQKAIEMIEGALSGSKFCAQTKHQVFIIDEAQELSRTAKNRLLKPFEREDLDAIWILCTTNPELFTKQFRNRCTQLTVRPLSEPACVKLMKKVLFAEGKSKILDTASLENIARVAAGIPRDALKHLEVVLHYADGKPESSDQELRTLIADKVNDLIRVPSEKLIAAYLGGLYDGDYTEALCVLPEVDDPASFLRAMLFYHCEAMFDQIDGAKLCRWPSLARFLKQVRPKFKTLNAAILGDLLTIMVESLGKTGSEKVGDDVLFRSATMRMATAVKEHLRATISK
jgi:DNA polymerase III subunit gamma/tau